jgi:hypothetical protein
MNPYSYPHLIFDKCAKTYDGEKTACQMLLEKLDICLQKLKLDPCLSPCTSINSKLIKDLNTRHKTLKLVQERADSTLKAIGIAKDFLGRTQSAQQ